MDELKQILKEIFIRDGVKVGSIVIEHEIIPEIIQRSDNRLTKTLIKECIRELEESGYLTIESKIGWNFTDRWFNEYINI